MDLLLMPETRAHVAAVLVGKTPLPPLLQNKDADSVPPAEIERAKDRALGMSLQDFEHQVAGTEEAGAAPVGPDGGIEAGSGRGVGRQMRKRVCDSGRHRER